MNKELNHTIRLGIFVMTGLVLVITGLYFIGSNRNIFGSNFRLYATFREVGGLQQGNSVRFSGIDVGTVHSILLTSDTSIRVEMVIDKDLAKFIRKNSIASVGTDGLMGNKLVNIEPGSPWNALALDGDEIPSRERLNTDAMLRTLDLTNQNIATVSANIKTITAQVNESKGTLYTILLDTSLALGLRRTLRNVESVSANMAAATNQLSSMVTGVKQGKGTLGLLLNDTIMEKDLQGIVGEFKKSSEKFSTLTSEVTVFVNSMNRGQGTVATLVNDSALAKTLKQSMINIQSASQKLDEDLEALKHNAFLRGYFKDKEKAAKKKEKKTQ